MRRQILLSGFILIAFVLGGPGVLVAALCPHAGALRESTAKNKAHACASHSTEHAQVKEHHSQAHLNHGAHLSGAFTIPETSESIGFISLPAETSCAHCLTHSNLPANAASLIRELNQSKRFAQAFDLRAATSGFSLPHTAFFASPVLFRQGAPPGSSSVPRHLLLSTFLI